LLLVVVTRNAGAERNIVRQVVDTHFFEYVEAFRFRFYFVERFPRFDERRVTVYEVPVIGVGILVGGCRVVLVLLVLRIAEREVSWVVRHRVFAFDVDLESR